MQHLYVSYSPEDYDLAHRLVDDLQAVGYGVFIDPVSEQGGMAWAAETREAIRTCGAVLMLIAPDERRRIGIRHEGVLALRRKKPVYVLRLSSGELPRYLQRHPHEIDFTGDYETALENLKAALPLAAALRFAPPSVAPRRPTNPPRKRDRELRRRRRWQFAGAAVLVVFVVLLGIAFGAVPL